MYPQFLRRERAPACSPTLGSFRGASFSFSLFLLIWNGVSVGSGAEFSVRLANGESMVGELRSIQDSTIQLHTTMGDKSLAFDALASVVPVADAKGETRPAGRQLVLMDGSILLFRTFEISGNRAIVQLPGEVRLEMALTALRQVRFRLQEGELADQWKEIVGAKHSGDALVYRKSRAKADPDAEGDEEFLDYLEGVVREVTSQVVKFAYEGDTIDVKLEKVDGIVFSRIAVESKSTLRCRLTDVSGSQWNLEEISLAAGKIRGRTVSGIELTLSADQLARLDFSSGNAVYLVQEHVEESHWSDFSDRLVSRLPSLKQYYEPMLAADSADGALTLQGTRYEQGWILHPVSKIVFRVPDGFSRLRAQVGVDRQSRGGEVGVVILGDGRELAQTTLRASDEHVWEVDLPIGEIRRIEFRVTSGSRLVQRSQLNVCDLKVTK